MLDAVALAFVWQQSTDGANGAQGPQGDLDAGQYDGDAHPAHAPEEALHPVGQRRIDVKEGYEGKGLGVHLVKLLKQRLIEQNTLPFYGTSESHAVSRTIAIRAGFMPAFSEFFVAETKDTLKPS